MTVGAGTERLVVARRWTGLGDCLISLTAAWRYARCTGRTLVADWRYSTYRRASGANAFDVVFAGTDRLAGVPFRSGDDVGDLYADGPFWPDAWSTERLADASRLGELPGMEHVVERIRANEDVDARVVVFDRCLADVAPSVEESREVLAALQPSSVIGDEVATFASERLARGPVLAVHVRHGNGGDVMGHASHWERPGWTSFQLLGVVERARRRLAEQYGREPRVLLCTDSPEVEAVFRTAVRTLVVRRKTHRPAGSGELHRAGDEDFAGLLDAATEMFLLARADVLVRFPSASYFSHWAATMKCPPPIDVEGIVASGFGASVS